MNKTLDITKQSGSVYELDGYPDDALQGMLMSILGTPYAVAYEKAADLLNIIENLGPARQPRHLAFVLTHYGLVPLGSTPGVGRGIPKRTLAYMKNWYDDVMHACLTSVRDNPTPDQLAYRLLVYLRKRFSKRGQRAVALSFVLGAEFIPYQQLSAELYEPPPKDDEPDDTPLHDSELLVYSMAPDQLTLFHAFQRLGTSKRFLSVMVRLAKRQSTTTELYNLLWVANTLLCASSFEQGVQSVQAQQEESKNKHEP